VSGVRLLLAEARGGPYTFAVNVPAHPIASPKRSPRETFMRLRYTTLGIALLALAALPGCIWIGGRSGPTRTESQTIDLGGAKSVRTELTMSAGELKISGGAEHLLEAEFTYNIPSWKPSVNYRVTGDEGDLRIEQPGGNHTTIGNSKYIWDLQLSDSVPMDLHIEMGAGNLNLVLGSLSLRNLKVEMGAGNGTIDLTGNWKQDLDAVMEGGVGNAKVILPRDVGVHVTVEGGLGSVNAAEFTKVDGAYVNDAYRKSPVTLNIKIEGGVGSVILEMAGARQPV
jgi:hypothetical protein